MFEVTERAGIGRAGKWEFCRQTVRTPNILFVHGERFPSPDIAEMVLARDGGTGGNECIHGSENSILGNECIPGSKDSGGVNRPDMQYSGKPCILDSGSFFFEMTGRGEAPPGASPPAYDVIPPKASQPAYAIPPDIHYPLGFSDPSTEKHGGNIQVLRAGSVPDNAPEVYVMANAMELTTHPGEMAERIREIREKTGYGKLLYAPGTGTPGQLAVLIYCGIDLFDSVPLILHARKGDYLFSGGAVNKDHMQELSCYCPACIASDGKHEYSQILSHNYYAAVAELRHVRNAIFKGDLRELAEYRSRSEPGMVALLRNLDVRHYDFQEKYLPVSGKGIFAAGKESINRPEIARFRKRVVERWRKRPETKILLLLPCSAKKPYSESVTHRAFRCAVLESGNPGIIQEVIVTSPLGIVPRELERFYPANDYDIPVTGHWDRDEMHMVTELVEWLLKNNSFDRVVINLPDELDFVKNAVGKAGAQYIDVCTDGERPAEHETVIRLAKCLREAVSGMQRVPMRDAIISSMVSMARFQFGPDIGEELLRGTEFRGRYPYLKFFRGGRQVCSYSPDRDMFALTPEGGKTLMEKGSFFVSIDDFKPHGDIMAVGILDADPVIRVGDEVVIVNKDKTGFIGTGIARMSPSEMLSCKRGVAVKTRSLAEGLGEG